MGDGANVASGKVKVGPIKLGAGVAVKSPVRAGYGAVGAISELKKRTTARFYDGRLGRGCLG